MENTPRKRKFIALCPPSDRKIFPYDKGYITESGNGLVECRYFDSLRFSRVRTFDSFVDAICFMHKEGYTVIK
jgi:hypothetical protein